MHVLDWFVKVSSEITVSIKDKSMEVDAINQVADGRKQRKQMTFDCGEYFLVTRRVSVEDRCKREEIATPRDDEHGGCQFVCDSALSAKIDVNDIELNDETDDENMEDRETGFDDGRV